MSDIKHFNSLHVDSFTIHQSSEILLGRDAGVRRLGGRRDVGAARGRRAVRHDGGAAAAEAGQARPHQGVQDRRALLRIVAPHPLARMQSRLQSPVHR